MSAQARQSIIPPSMQTMYDVYHFAPAIRVGDMIWLSGQIGLDAEGRPGKDMEAQAHLVFENMRTVLRAAGSDLADVVELTSFLTDVQTDLAIFSAVKDIYFPEQYPAWTSAGVKALANPRLLVEVRAVAVAGSGPA